MDSGFNTNSLVPDLVTVIAAEQCNRAAALPGGASFSCCIHKPLLMGAACLREERLLLQETILRGARVPPQAQELLGRSGFQHCEPAHLCGGVAAFLTLMDASPGLPGPLSLPHWEQGTGLEPSVSGTPHEGMQQQERTHTNVVMKPQRRKQDWRPCVCCCLILTAIWMKPALGLGVVQHLGVHYHFLLGLQINSCVAVHPWHSNFILHAPKGTDLGGVNTIDLSIAPLMLSVLCRRLSA